LKPRLRRLPDGLIVVYATASIREREPAWFPHGSGRLLFSRTLEFIMSYRPRLEASRLAYQRAMKVMPGGNTRSSVYEAPFPIYLREGRGAFVTDLDGNNYLDLQNNFTTLIHGHGHPAIIAALGEQIGRGLCFSNPTTSEIELAELLCARVPYFEHVRFTNTGSEAVMMAIKAARAMTGRPKIAKCEGAYHGNYDYVEASFDPVPADWRTARPSPTPYNKGTPVSVLQEVVVIPFNDVAATEEVLREHKHTIAAVLVDPLPSRAGLLPISPAYLKFLRAFTTQHGILLISDEVLSFRLGYQGAMGSYGVEPDLCTFGKIVGGGLPVGAIAGRADMMRVFNPSLGKPPVSQAGTFTANPLSMTAGAAAMRAFSETAQLRLNALGDAARDGLRHAFAVTGVAGQVTGAGSLFCIFLGEREVHDYAGAYHAWQDRRRLNQLIAFCVEEGILLSRIGLGALSTPMTLEMVDALGGKFANALAKLKATEPATAVA
jgi:glutamate-1-semialdehyde 2,1-aminomutase